MLKSTLTGGWKMGDRPIPLADGTVPLLGVVLASGKLAKAVFDAHRAVTSDAMRRMCIAVEWHAVAMSNPFAVTWQQRIIALKTGFEALLGESNSRECARRLRALFESATLAHRDVLPSSSLLWSPKERIDLLRTHRKKPDVRGELEDWFMELARARNDIIHEGRLTTTQYVAPPERPLSRYAGLLFWSGERLLREAIKATLGADILLCGPLKSRARWDKIWQALQAVGQLRSPAILPPRQGPPPRDVPMLMKELGSSAANQVLMTGGLAAAPLLKRQRRS